MKHPPSAAELSVRLTFLELADPVCMAFEGVWRKNKQPPRIEDYLQDYQGDERQWLLRELLLLELDYRRQHGENARAEDYCQRFPDDAELIGRVFHRHEETMIGPPAGDTVDAQTPPPPPIVQDKQFGQYELLDKLGEGGMGTVYRARQKGAERDVALKLIRFDRLSALSAKSRAEVTARFYEEIKTAATLDHDHIVRVFDVGQLYDQPYFAMQYIAGQSLAEMLKENTLHGREAARLLVPICRAVATAHARGIIHRDIKPNNILVDQSGKPYMADFGLAKRQDADQKLSATDQVLGTAPYMPPEQVLGKDVTTAADIYSLGATLYEMLTGRPPFQGSSSIETMRQVVQVEPTSPRVLNAAIDRDIESICLKCLDKDPARRYASAHELADDLHRFCHGKPVVARPITRAARLARWGRRNPLVATLGAGSAVLCLTALVLMLTLGFVSWLSFQRANDFVESQRKSGETIDEFETRFQRQVNYFDVQEAEIESLQAKSKSQQDELDRLRTELGQEREVGAAYEAELAIVVAESREHIASSAQQAALARYRQQRELADRLQFVQQRIQGGKFDEALRILKMFEERDRTVIGRALLGQTSGVLGSIEPRAFGWAVPRRGVVDLHLPEGDLRVNEVHWVGVRDAQKGDDLAIVTNKGVSIWNISTDRRGTPPFDWLATPRHSDLKLRQAQWVDLGAEAIVAYQPYLAQTMPWVAVATDDSVHAFFYQPPGLSGVPMAELKTVKVPVSFRIVQMAVRGELVYLLSDDGSLHVWKPDAKKVADQFAQRKVRFDGKITSIASSLYFFVLFVGCSDGKVGAYDEQSKTIKLSEDFAGEGKITHLAMAYAADREPRIIVADDRGNIDMAYNNGESPLVSRLASVGAPIRSLTTCVVPDPASGQVGQLLCVLTNDKRLIVWQLINDELSAKIGEFPQAFDATDIWQVGLDQRLLLRDAAGGCDWIDLHSLWNNVKRRAAITLPRDIQGIDMPAEGDEWLVQFSWDMTGVVSPEYLASLTDHDAWNRDLGKTGVRGKVQFVPTLSRIRIVAFSNSPKYFAAASSGELAIYRNRQLDVPPEVVATYRVSLGEEPQWTCFSPDGSQVLVGTKEKVQVIDLGELWPLAEAPLRAAVPSQLPERIRQCAERVGAIRTTKCSRDGSLAMLDAVGWIHLWPADLDKPYLLLTPGDVSAIAFSRDGSELAVAVGTTIYVWDVLSGARAGSLSIPAKGAIKHLAFSSTSGELVAATETETVLLGVGSSK